MQGDILKLHRPDEFSQDFSYGVLINADCDMENKKNDGVIAFLPIYKFEEYLDKFWVNNFKQMQLNNAKSALIKRLEKEKDFDDLCNWIRSLSSIDETKDVAISLHEKLKFKKAEELEALLQKIYYSLSLCNSAATILKQYAPQQAPKEFIEAQLNAAKKGIGEGNLFFSEIKGVRDLGFVIRSNRIYSISEKQCHKEFSQFQAYGSDKETNVYRIGKFSAIYQMKIAQTFAYQYSRIGLSNEITNLSTIAIDALCHKFLEEV